MACRVYQNFHPSNALNVTDFLPDDMYEKMGDIKFTGFAIDSCALSLKMTLPGYHRSVADAAAWAGFGELTDSWDQFDSHGYTSFHSSCL